MLERSWSGFTIDIVSSSRHPLFDVAFDRLWCEFGHKGEMERRDVIADRLAWDPQRPARGHALLYEMLVIRRGDEIAAVRDHTAIATADAVAGAAGARVVVHLSHVLVEPALRGSGLASWLRALPVDTARRCVARARAGLRATEGGREDAGALPPITLVAEMERDDGTTPAVVRRLRSYAKAGFRVVDPARVAYSQPDFRSAEEIDGTSVQAVPLSLVLRRVGREHEQAMPGRELRELVGALQAMFGEHVREDHMKVVRELAAAMPADDEAVALLVPGAAAGKEDARR